MTKFEDWFYRKNGGLSEADNAFYEIAQEFLHGNYGSQTNVIECLMRKAWDARYSTLTYHDL